MRKIAIAFALASAAVLAPHHAAAQAPMASPVRQKQLMLSRAILAPGMACPWATTPADGRLMSIAQYEPLFALLQTTYGGNGIETFALPDLRSESNNGQIYCVVVNLGYFPWRN